MSPPHSTHHQAATSTRGATGCFRFVALRNLCYPKYPTAILSPATCTPLTAIKHVARPFKVARWGLGEAKASHYMFLSFHFIASRQPTLSFMATSVVRPFKVARWGLGEAKEAVRELRVSHPNRAGGPGSSVRAGTMWGIYVDHPRLVLQMWKTIALSSGFHTV